MSAPAWNRRRRVVRARLARRRAERSAAEALAWIDVVFAGHHAIGYDVPARLPHWQRASFLAQMTAHHLRRAS